LLPRVREVLPESLGVAAVLLADSTCVFHGAGCFVELLLLRQELRVDGGSSFEFLLQGVDWGGLLAGAHFAGGSIIRFVMLLKERFETSAACATYLRAESGAQIFRDAGGQSIKPQRALWRPKHLGKPPVFLTGEAAAGSFGRGEDLAQPGIRIAGVGEWLEFAVLEPKEAGGRAIQENFFHFVAGAALGEFNMDLGREFSSPRTDFFDVSASDVVRVKEGTAHGFEEGGFAGAVGGVDHIQTIGEGSEFHRVEKATPILGSQRMEDHARTFSCKAKSCSNA
jgi:hypothetical protein